MAAPQADRKRKQNEKIRLVAFLGKNALFMCVSTILVH